MNDKKLMLTQVSRLEEAFEVVKANVAIQAVLGKDPFQEGIKAGTWEWWASVMQTSGQEVTGEELMHIKLKYGDAFSAKYVQEIRNERKA